MNAPRWVWIAVGVAAIAVTLYLVSFNVYWRR
jgi:hypothetical protein